MNYQLIEELDWRDLETSSINKFLLKLSKFKLSWILNMVFGVFVVDTNYHMPEILSLHQPHTPLVPSLQNPSTTIYRLQSWSKVMEWGERSSDGVLSACTW